MISNNNKREEVVEQLLLLESSPNFNIPGYISNIYKYNGGFPDDTIVGSLIDSFEWAVTPEGHTYWSHLNAQFIEKGELTVGDIKIALQELYFEKYPEAFI